MKTLTDLLLEAADSIESLGTGLTPSDVVAVSVFEEFTTVHVNEAGATKLTAKLGEPFIDTCRNRMWANPAVERESWMSDGSFDHARGYWPGRLQLQASSAVGPEPERLPSGRTTEEASKAIFGEVVAEDDYPF